MTRGLPGDSVVENPPAKAGDTDLIPGLGRSYMPWSRLSRAPQILSLCSRAWELQRLKPECFKAHAPQQEKPLR